MMSITAYDEECATSKKRYCHLLGRTVLMAILSNSGMDRHASCRSTWKPLDLGRDAGERLPDVTQTMRPPSTWTSVSTSHDVSGEGTLLSRMPFSYTHTTHRCESFYSRSRKRAYLQSGLVSCAQIDWSISSAPSLPQQKLYL